MKYILIITFSFFLAQCNSQTTKPVQTYENTTPVEVTSTDGYARAYFSSGCFWCVEEIYENVIGVQESISGYSGGKMQQPTYRNHGDHAEANEIIYDASKVSFKTLVDVYFASQNIEQKKGQGPDRGESYRSIIFYQNAEQKQIIENKIQVLTQQGYDVAAIVQPFEKFWVAEDYHQDYAKLHPNHPYIKGVSIPRFERFAKKMPEIIKHH